MSKNIGHMRTTFVQPSGVDFVSNVKGEKVAIGKLSLVGGRQLAVATFAMP